MSLSPSTFGYLVPTPEQNSRMNDARRSADAYGRTIETVVPDGPDKTYALRKLREVAMWVNVAITRHADGTPRE